MIDEANILRTIKKMIGGDVDSDDFDVDLVVAINSAISTLYQIGIETLNTNGDCFAIVTGDETWFDYLGEYKFINMVKEYIYQKVRLAFDPPQNSFLVNAIQDQIKETEWRLKVAVETDNQEE